MRIGIIVATDFELGEARKIIDNIKEEEHFNLVFVSGILSKKEVVLVKSGMGKVNSARTAQILIDKFNVDKVINIGAAGALNPNLNVNDIVIGDKLVQYDFDVSTLDDVERGEIQGIGKYIKSDTSLVNVCSAAIDNMEDKQFSVKVGTIATADLFCTDANIAKNIREEFGAECVEMEGAAVAQVCFLDNIPFLVIRGISDTPNRK